MNKLELVNDIIELLKNKAPLSHIEGGAMIFDLKYKKFVYYIDSRTLYEVIPGERNKFLAKLNKRSKLIESVSELELIVIMDEIKQYKLI